MVIVFFMMDSGLLENIMENRHQYCNGEIIVIYGINAVFGRYNILLVNLQRHRLSEARSDISYI